MSLNIGEIDIYKAYFVKYIRDNDDCKSVWKAFMEYNISPSSPSSQLITRDVVDVANYQLNEPPLPLNAYSWQEAWFTDCFARPCCP